MNGNSTTPAATASTRRAHPEWHGPFEQSTTSTAAPVLRVENSLTETKTSLIPIKPHHLSFYICGPTVYDSAHLGHARAYVTFDILRRVLTDYFQYSMFFVMNITDVDDKIILRARRNHLYQQYIQSPAGKNIDSVIGDIRLAMDSELEAKMKRVSEVEQQIQQRKTPDEELQTTLEQEKLKLQQVEADITTFTDALHNKASVEELWKIGQSALSVWLDIKHGHTITDQSIFRAHAAHYEAEFLQDMQNLNVRDADATTRVTEYIPQIIALVEKIIANGFAYESNGSVYFDTVAFQSAGRPYGKLAPWCVGNHELIAEGEGALSTDSEKRNASDFALWKRSKAGEPQWESQWGGGRPGWHIECSAMAGDLLGWNFDIHAGGSDLKFPHHDNELAQSEAASGAKQWVNHFWHAGHLNIKGLKMSKSLKNFTTIRTLLESGVSARTIRLMFLAAQWNGTLNFSQDSLDAARTREKSFNEFFADMAAALRSKTIASEAQLWTATDRDIHQKLQAVKDQVHERLCDNFDYPAVILLLSELVTSAQKYRTLPDYKSVILRQYVSYVDRILRTFGVMSDTEPGFVGAGAGDTRLTGVLDAMTTFRATIRNAAISDPINTKQILRICDELRDTILPNVGVRLEDTDSGSIWKLADADELRRERETEQREKQVKLLQKLKIRYETDLKTLDKAQQSSQSPVTYFPAKKEYGSYDAEGKPLTDLQGQELTKSQLKKVAKEYQTQQAAHTKYQNELKVNPNYVQQLQENLEKLKTEIAALEQSTK